MLNHRGPRLLGARPIDRHQPLVDHFVRVLAKRRRRAIDFEAKIGDSDRISDRLSRHPVGKLDWLHQTHRLHMRIGKDLRVAHDRRAGHAAPVELRKPLRRGSRLEPSLQDVGQLRLMLCPGRDAFESRVVGQFGSSDRMANFAPELIIARRDDEIRIGRMERLIWRIARMGGAETLPRQSGAEIFAGLERSDAEERPEHRAVDLRTDAGATHFHDGGEDGIGRIEPGGEVGHRHAALHRRSTVDAGDAHQAADALYRDIESASLRVWPRLPEPGNGAIDEPRILQACVFVTEAQTVQCPGAEILDQNVAHAQKRLDERQPAFGLEIGADRTLVPVDRSEILAERDPVAIGLQRRPASHAIAAARILDLDDVGAEVGQQRAGERPGGDLRKLQHTQACQGPGAFGAGCARKRIHVIPPPGCEPSPALLP